MYKLFSFLSDASGVLALVLSTYILIRDHRRERLRFSVDVIDFASRGNSSYFYLVILNKSRSPLVITQVIFDGILCELDPKRVRNGPGDWNFQHTPQFPLAIEAQAAQMVYLEFVAPRQKQLAPDMPVTLRIHTISQAVSKTLILGKRRRYLNTSRNTQ